MNIEFRRFLDRAPWAYTQPIDAEVRAIADLGPRLAVHGSDDWGTVGSAVHAYLGTEFAGLEEPERRRLADRIVSRWGVSQTIDAELLLKAGERFETYLDAEFLGWKRHREAIGWRPEGQTMEGGSTSFSRARTDSWSWTTRRIPETPRRTTSARNTSARCTPTN